MPNQSLSAEESVIKTNPCHQEPSILEQGSAKFFCIWPDSKIA